MIIAGVAGRAVDGGGMSLNEEDHVDLEVVAVGSFIELRTGYVGSQHAYQLTPEDARRLARALDSAADEYFNR